MWLIWIFHEGILSFWRNLASSPGYRKHLYFMDSILIHFFFHSQSLLAFPNNISYFCSLLSHLAYPDVTDLSKSKKSTTTSFRGSLYLRSTLVVSMYEYSNCSPRFSCKCKQKCIMNCYCHLSFWLVYDSSLTNWVGHSHRKVVQHGCFSPRYRVHY